MIKSLSFVITLASLSVVSSCQSTKPVAAPATPATSAPAPATTTTTTTSAGTEAEARAVLARYVQQLPNAAVYQLASATATDVQTKWQIMVPRTDWAKVMPNAAAFEVDKQTGAVTMLRVR